MISKNLSSAADAVLLAKGKVILTELWLFLIPLICAVLTRKPGSFYMDFYTIWFFVAAAINIVFIVLFLIRRPYNYWLWVFGFFIVPPALGVLGVFIGMLGSGVTC